MVIGDTSIGSREGTKVECCSTGKHVSLFRNIIPADAEDLAFFFCDRTYILFLATYSGYGDLYRIVSYALQTRTTVLVGSSLAER